MPRSRRYLPIKQPSIFYRLRSVWLVLGMLTVVVGVLVGWFVYEGQRPVLSADVVQTSPLAITHRDQRLIETVIPFGTSARGIADILKGSGFDIHQGMFIWHARWLGVLKNLQAGVYFFEPGLTKNQVILRLANRDPSHTQFRIIEGWTVRQVLDAISEHSAIDFDLDPKALPPQKLAASLGLHANHAEGWIYPDAYMLPKPVAGQGNGNSKGFSATLLLARAAALQTRVLEEAWQNRDPALPYNNMYEALIVASIVEKETQHPGDREKVAAVFANRVRLGMPLQADPTVIYGLRRPFDGRITKKDLRSDTPYNTYTRKTLPVTPISNPGRSALKAVMQPADTRHLFFVARGDGSSEFSETLKDHNIAVNRYIRGIMSGGER
jgi:UPF0755 protein